MSAQDLGKTLLAEIEEVGLDEVCRAFAHKHQTTIDNSHWQYRS